jgi:predicted lactoylglutathione lyase
MRILLLVLLCLGCAAKEKQLMEVQPTTPPLANYLQIAISLREPTGDVSKLRPFYEKLGFKVIDQAGPPVPFLLMTDGLILLRLDECEFATPRLDYFTTDAPNQIKRLESLGISYSTEMACTRKRWVTNFRDPNDQQFAIIEDHRAPLPKDRQSHSACGTFGEFSIHTTNRDASVQFYRNLGFTAQLFETPYPWAILRDGNITIGLHQSDEFTRTTLTYFSKDSVERIEKLKAAGMKFTNEQKNAAGKVANATLQAPDGQMFFIFEE